MTRTRAEERRRCTCLAGRPVLVRADSAFYSYALVTAALKTGAHVSITVRMDLAVKRAIAAIGADAWQASTDR